ncbi:NADP-dependent oxidoreductase [Croceicoccus sp. YJ47]|uniref:NADP-dependent oxidoreductase n=1 Tax=Croceicoccus sp. YJ47 TaxID=2798724 RepID=UPI0019241629|nr:NADP-dependent oxidoreductase [Croceicoccus sp. YJ47]QQN75309.1 NADP-dependent oxidoreductase [Croceicoccus sp. YJ47]
MKAQRIHEWGGPDRLTLDDVPAPDVSDGEVLVAVKAVGINPVDWKLMTGKAPVLPELPLVPGGDIAGVVERVGEGVDGLSPGDRVFGLIGLTGAYAGKVAVAASSLARIPGNVDFPAAAALPLVSLTALQGMLSDGREVGSLDILVHGGAGGVGTAAIQIARAMGARVTASASAEKAQFVKNLGAGQVVDFRSGTILDPSSFDMLIDLVGDSQETALWKLVRRGGSVIRIAGGATAPAEEEVGGVRAYKVRVRPNGEHMNKVASLLDSGAISAPIDAIFPFEDAVEALEMVKAGHVKGKVVLTLS